MSRPCIGLGAGPHWYGPGPAYIIIIIKLVWAPARIGLGLARAWARIGPALVRIGLRWFHWVEDNQFLGVEDNQLLEC